MDTKVYRSALNSKTGWKEQDCEVHTTISKEGLSISFEIDSGTRGSRFNIVIPVAQLPKLGAAMHAVYDASLKAIKRDPTDEEIADFILSKVKQ